MVIDYRSANFKYVKMLDTLLSGIGALNYAVDARRSTKIPLVGKTGAEKSAQWQK